MFPGEGGPPPRELGVDLGGLKWFGRRCDLPPGPLTVCLTDMFDEARGSTAERLVLCSSSPPPRVCGRHALSSLAHRIGMLDEEIAALDTRITPLLESHPPYVLNVYGVGIDTAATFLVSAGESCPLDHRDLRAGARSPDPGLHGAPGEGRT